MPASFLPRVSCPSIPAGSCPLRRPLSAKSSPRSEDSVQLSRKLAAAPPPTEILPLAPAPRRQPLIGRWAANTRCCDTFRAGRAPPAARVENYCACGSGILFCGYIPHSASLRRRKSPRSNRPRGWGTGRASSAGPGVRGRGGGWGREAAPASPGTWRGRTTRSG